MVHFASHAVFTGNPETSFLLTHDGRLTLDRMGDMIGQTRFRDTPLELLVLSACETAAGDEGAALGLAGVAIRSGARSALGSLWKITDVAAYELMVAFYEELKDPSVSKARALQLAQTRLFEGDRFAHPYYWSPYLLISNWL
jgi:CHAT domain-containing protein